MKYQFIAAATILNFDISKVVDLKKKTTDCCCLRVPGFKH